MATIYPPYVIERSSRGERTYDIFSRLLMDRIVFPRHADQRRCREHHHRAAAVPRGRTTGPRHLRVHQLAGGSVSAGLAIYDTMQYLKAPVNTICMGLAASMGSFLLAAGRKGSAVRCRTAGS
jgi:ATP-dependent Clp protease protease subunit